MSGKIRIIKFKQWLDEWNDYSSLEEPGRRRPEGHLYVFSMPAAELRALSDVYRRVRLGADAEGIQRKRDDGRTAKIQRFVRYGYPYGALRPSLRNAENDNLKKPGWLPTSIVVNLLVDGDVRHGKTVKREHLLTVREESAGTFLNYPDPPTSKDDLAPIEIIDGQHRLWAFDDTYSEQAIPDDFELPVVAFQGLAVSWQAYLFWSINVSPTRINPSLAFDLYPVLRSQDWLDRTGELNVYREARAQEIAEVLNAHPSSPWRDRINMLGERGVGGVSQSGWIRALTSSFLATGKYPSRPGLFQANLTGFEQPLSWSRGQQTAFVIQLWREIQSAIERTPQHWWIQGFGKNASRAFTDKTSMLNQDMGVRAVLATANDIFYSNAELWRLEQWRASGEPDEQEVAEEVTDYLDAISHTYFHRFMVDLADQLAAFDWRSLEGPGVRGVPDLETLKRSFRGSGGYTALRREVLEAIGEGDGQVSQTARELAPNMVD